MILHITQIATHSRAVIVIRTTAGASTAGSIGTPKLRPVITETVRGNNNRLLLLCATSVRCSNQT